MFKVSSPTMVRFISHRFSVNDIRFQTPRFSLLRCPGNDNNSSVVLIMTLNSSGANKEMILALGFFDQLRQKSGIDCLIGYEAHVHFPHSRLVWKPISSVSPNTCDLLAPPIQPSWYCAYLNVIIIIIIIIMLLLLLWAGCNLRRHGWFSLFSRTLAV